MYSNNLSITSMRTATDEQFTTLFRHRDPDDYTESQFVDEYKSKRTQAQKDALVLQGLGITHLQIVEKLTRIIGKGNAVFTEAYQKQQQSRRPIELQVPILRSEIDDEGISFNVSGFEIRTFGSEECPLCDHRIIGPRTYFIENARKHEIIKVQEMFLHFLRNHEYFARPSDCRIEPTTICKVLGLKPRSVDEDEEWEVIPSCFSLANLI